MKLNWDLVFKYIGAIAILTVSIIVATKPKGCGKTIEMKSEVKIQLDQLDTCKSTL